MSTPEYRARGITSPVSSRVATSRKCTSTSSAPPTRTPYAIIEPSSVVQRIHRGVLVRTQLRGVNQLLIRTMQPHPHIDRSLILVGQSFGEEVPLATTRRHADKIHLQQLPHLVDDRRQHLHLGKIQGGISVLCGDVSPRLRAMGIFEPPV